MSDSGRAASDVLADLAALAQRQAELTAELASALRAPAPAAPPAPVAGEGPEFLTTAEAASFLGVSTSHLKALRAEGGGPAFLRVGRAVRYARSALFAHTVRSPSAAPRALPSGARYDQRSR